MVYIRDAQSSVLFIMADNVRINESIRAPEVRVVGSEGENLGVMTTKAAFEQALDQGLDLIEVSPKAVPPVARIGDYGKFKYELKKKEKEIKAKSHVTETKVAQVKIGTSEGDLVRKAKKIAQWIAEGHRVKIDLFLWGRYKYMEPAFLKNRLERFLAIVPESFKIADEMKKSPKGFSVTIEPDKSGKGNPFAAKNVESAPTEPDTQQENHESR